MNLPRYCFLEVPVAFRGADEEAFQVYSIQGDDIPLEYVMGYSELEEICRNSGWTCPPKQSTLHHTFPEPLEFMNNIKVV